MEFDRIADKKRVDFITSSIKAAAEQNSRVLDMGCGNGVISKAIAVLGYRVDAVDVSEKTITSARLSNSHENINYRVAGAGELLLEAGIYSAIICSEVLEHLHQPGQLLNVLHKALRNEGVLIVTVPNGVGPRELFVTRPVQFISRKNNFLSRLLAVSKRTLGYTGTTVQSSADDLTHVQFFTMTELRRLAHAGGFRIVNWKASNFIEQVFPFSLLTKKFRSLQRLDCKIADILPVIFTSGFMMVWKKI